MQPIRTDGPTVLDERTSAAKHRRPSIIITLVVTAIGLLLIAASLAIAGSDNSTNTMGGEEVAVGAASGTVSVLAAAVDVGLSPGLCRIYLHRPREPAALCGHSANAHRPEQSEQLNAWVSAALSAPSHSPSSANDGLLSELGSDSVHPTTCSRHR